MSSCDVSVCPVGHRDEEEEKISIDFCSQRLKKIIILCCFLHFIIFLEENMFNYNLHVIFFLVPNCPFYYVGAKLSWCQISGAKLSDAKLSGCQIVRFLTLGAKLSGAKLSGAKLSHNPWTFPLKEKKNKVNFYSSDNV